MADGGFAALDHAAWRQEHLRGLIVAATNGLFKAKYVLLAGARGVGATF